MKNKINIAISVILAALIFFSFVYAVYVLSRIIPCAGKIATIGVDAYSDSNCTTILKEINWGNNILPNSTLSQVIYLKNNGTCAITLSMNTSGWTSTHLTPFNLSWNCTNYKLEANNSTGAELSLTIPNDVTASTTFSFNITITGTSV